MTGEPGTFPRRLVAQARRLGRKVALREKKYGIWQEVTWEQYAAQVRAVCLGLVRLGLERGDTVAVISGNRPAWLYVELAAQSAGAIPLGIFVDSLPDQVQRILDHSEARFVLVEDQEQADKVLSVRDALPRLERIIVDDMRGLEDYRRPDGRRARGRGRGGPRARRAASRVSTRSCSSGEAPPTWPCSRTPRGPPVPRRPR